MPAVSSSKGSSPLLAHQRTTNFEREQGGHSFVNSRPPGPSFENKFLLAPTKPDSSEFALAVDTVNCTSWSSIKSWLGSTSSHVVLVQEHRLRDSESLGEASNWASSNGWKSIFAAANSAPGGGSSGGVAILVRNFLGLYIPRGGSVLVPGRAVQGCVQIPGGQSLQVLSLYLHDTEGLSDRNLQLLADVGSNLDVCDMPFLVGADFNMQPDTLKSSLFASKLSANIVFPDAPGTCVGSGGQVRMYDYFVASSGLSKAVAKVSVDHGSDIKTHYPTTVRFYPEMASLYALSFAKIPKIAVEVPIGPPNKVPSADVVLDCAKYGLELVQNRAKRSDMQRHLDTLYHVWADAAEVELAISRHDQLKSAGLRGRPPKLIWVSVLDADRQRREVRQPGLVGFRWLCKAVNALRAVLAAGADRQACQPYLQAILHPPDSIKDKLQDCSDELQGLRAFLNDMSFDDLQEKWFEVLEEHEFNINSAFDRYAGQAKVASQRSWRAWLLDGIDSGGRRAHSWTKEQKPWRPTTTLSAHGQVLADPCSLLESEAFKFASLWESTELEPDESPIEYQDPLDLITPEELRDISKSYSKVSAVGIDGFHCRHICSLSEPLLLVLSILLNIMESTSMLPRQIKTIVLFLLEKPAGGFRPIGLFSAAYRIWGRARRTAASAWEAANSRSYLGASAFCGASDVIWRQALRSELGVRSGDVAVSVLWDLYKFYERIPLDVLLARADMLNFPRCIIRLAVSAYRGPRFVSLSSLVDGPHFARFGVIAGCSMATTGVRIFLIPVLDTLRLPQQLYLSVYIDDYSLNAVGPERYVSSHIKESAAMLADLVRSELHSTISEDKASLISSCPKLGVALRKFFGGLSGSSVSTAVNLGVDDTVGRSRRRPKMAPKFHQRKKVLKTRVKRIARARAILGRHARKIFASGGLAAATYGSEIHGVSNYELDNLRRAFGRVVKPSSGSRSLTTLTILEQDPCWFPSVSPVVRYAKEIWSNQLREFEFLIPFSQLREAWSSAFTAEDCTWRSCSGPLSAARLSLERIGWSMEDFATLTTDMGVKISLTTTSPKLIKRMLHQGVLRSLERSSGQKLGFENRSCFDVVKAQLRSSKLSPLQKGSLKCFACDGLWTRTRAQAAGYALADDDLLCALCGEAPDTIPHRLYECSAVQDQRLEIVDQDFVRNALAARSDQVEYQLYTKACFPHPGDRLPPPAKESDITVSWTGSTSTSTEISGHVFFDGSQLKYDIPELDRAGWGLAVFNDDLEHVCSISGPIWADLPQTSQAGEFGAYGASNEFLVGPSVGYSDCSNVVKQFAQPLAKQTHYKRPYAAMFLKRNSFFTRVNKVRAHVADSADLTDTERFLKRGNDAADLAAKQGAALHPQPSPSELHEVNRLTSAARKVCKLAYSLLPLWPKLDLSDVPWVRGSAPVAKEVVNSEAHQWLWCRTFWRCQTCLQFKRQYACPPASGCDGQLPSVARCFQERGHKVVCLNCSNSTCLYLCTRCFGYTCGGQFKKLRSVCVPEAKGSTSKYAAAVRKSLSRGMHPKLAGVTCEIFNPEDFEQDD